MPRQKYSASPVNNKAPAVAADGTNPPIAKEEKLYIKNLNYLFEYYQQNKSLIQKISSHRYLKFISLNIKRNIY